MSTSYIESHFCSQAHNSYSKAPSTPATMSKQRTTLLPKTATMSNEFIVTFNVTINSFDIVDDFVLLRKSNVASIFLLVLNAAFDCDNTKTP